jgi:uncharacterized protein DUF4124
MPRQLGLVFLAVFFAQPVLAQEFYKWKDQKGQWHYSDFPPSGVTAERMESGDNAQKSASQPSVPSTAGQEKMEDGWDRPARGASDVDPLESVSRRLLVFPPSDPSNPVSEWIPVESFESVKECQRARAVLLTPDTEDFRIIRSRCISLAEFKPSKEAKMIVAATYLESDPGGFSTWVLYGRVFNGGQTTARNVVVRYRVRDTRGIIYANGEILPASHDILPLTFAEYRGQIVGSAGGSDRWVETEANWSKD